MDRRSVSFSFVSIVKTFHQKPSYFLFISRRQVRSFFHTSLLAQYRLYKLAMRIPLPHSVHTPFAGRGYTEQSSYSVHPIVLPSVLHKYSPCIYLVIIVRLISPVSCCCCGSIGSSIQPKARSNNKRQPVFFP